MRSTAQDQGSFAAGSILPKTAMDSKAIQVMAKAMGEAQEHAFMQCKAFGGQLSAFSDDMDAFPWRNLPFECQV